MKTYTNLEQSKKLAEILPLESADMSYSFNFNSETYEVSTVPYKDWIIPKYAQPDDGFGQVIPCWSLAALFSVFPYYEINNNGVNIQLSVKGEALITKKGEYLLDLAVNMIIHLHEFKML